MTSLTFANRVFITSTAGLGGTESRWVDGFVDPHEGRLYLPAGAWVVPGDTVQTGGQLGSYRVAALPEEWRNPFTGWEAGVVVALQRIDGAALPDAALLERPGPPVFDREANEYVPSWQPLGTWRVRVELPTSEGSELDVAEQRLTLQPFLVTAPLELTDVQPGDRLTVTASADPRLVGRPLEVTRIKAGSLANARQFSVVDNQG